MKFFVNENCIGCGLCNGICPEVFTMNDGVAVADPGPVDDALKSGAVEAQNSCPVNAIESQG